MAITKKKKTSKKKDWKETKKGRVENGDYAIVTLPDGSKNKYAVYKNGKIIGFGSDLDEVKEICEACEK